MILRGPGMYGQSPCPFVPLTQTTNIHTCVPTEWMFQSENFSPSPPHWVTMVELKLQVYELSTRSCETFILSWCIHVQMHTFSWFLTAWNWLVCFWFHRPWQQHGCCFGSKAVDISMVLMITTSESTGWRLSAIPTITAGIIWKSRQATV